MLVSEHFKREQRRFRFRVQGTKTVSYYGSFDVEPMRTHFDELNEIEYLVQVNRLELNYFNNECKNELMDE